MVPALGARSLNCWTPREGPWSVSMIHLGMQYFAQVFFLRPHFYPLMGRTYLTILS